jgi:esterase/lipase superfamily enzyme
MTRTKKRISIAVLGILIIGGIWFYYAYFMSTNAAIRHAEEFLFRRMTVSQLAEQGEYRHFFVTNRRQDTGDMPLEESFNTEREDALKFGSFDISIEPSLGLGMIINPTEWFQNEEIRLSGIREVEKAAFVEKLGRFVDASPGRSLLIVVHGFREGFSSALRKTAFIASILDINTPVLLFDWPGDQGSSMRGYRKARTVAEASGADLARTIEIIVREIRPDHLSLIANSMGGQVVVNAFGVLYADADMADAEKELDHVVLTAPDVDHAEFNQQFKDEIRAFANDLTVYVSSNDRALLMSRVINRGTRLGESTLSTDQLAEAESLSRLVEPDSDLIRLVDVTPVNRTRNFHNFSLETPEFFDDLYLRLTSDDIPRNRLVYRVQTPNDSVYWVLTRGR